MESVFNKFLNQISVALFGNRELTEKAAEQQRYIDGIIEKIVDDIDPRLRGISGYKKKLFPCVDHMLSYGEEVCAHLPGPIEFSEEACRSNSTVRALFANYKNMVDVFSRSRELQDFFRQHPSADHAFMVLGMEKTEARVFGMEQQGEIIRKDVPQVNVSFDDYRITHPSYDEQTLRFNLRERALHECVAQTIKRLMEQREYKDQMHEHEVKLKMQLGMLQNQHEGLMSLMNDDAPIVAKISDVKEQLQKVEHHIGQIKQDIGTLDSFLEKVADLLDRPAEMLHVSEVSLCLDRMNRLIDEEAGKEGDCITLAQVEFGDKVKRVGVLASFPRKELLPMSKLGSVKFA